MSIRQISDWFDKAVPEPQPKNRSTQMGVHFEEVAEMLSTLRGGDQRSSARLLAIKDFMNAFATEMKEGRLNIVVDDEVELLDSLCDQIVTAVGVGRLNGMDMVRAVAEVASSNDSKFDENGEPIFNEDMKIIKGPNYFRPQLANFLRPNENVDQRP